MLQLEPLIADSEIRSIVAALINQISIDTAFCRDQRNRHLAHRDLPLAIEDETAKPIQLGSRNEVRQALDRIGQVLNVIAKHYLDTTILFDMGRQPGGALHLLFTLDNGLRFEEEHEQRIQRDEWRPDDYLPRDI